MVHNTASTLVSDKSADSSMTSFAPQAWISRCEPALVTHSAGALVGLAFAVKDNMDVAGMPTTAACPGFAFTPAQHAVVVQKLLDAGATLVGKTNLDQFACGLNGTRSPYGAVPNAFNPAYVSGGSSSGSAYVVATGQVDFALGTDTAGSGRVPAGLNNIVGLKPSKGLISTRGVLPAAQSVDCVSIFSRTPDVAAKVLEVLLRSRQLVVDQAEHVVRALRAYETGSADFADCLIERTAAAAGCDRTVTFNVSASKSAGMVLLN